MRTLVSLALVGLSGCIVHIGSGDLVDVDLPVDAFDAMAAEQGLVVRHVEGERAVTAHIDDNLRDLLVVEVVDGELRMGFGDLPILVDPSDDAWIEVVAPPPERFSASGGASIDAVGAGEVVRLSASGGAGIEVVVTATTRAEVSASGGADVTLGGTAPAVDVDASGGATVTSTIKAGSASVSASGGAHVSVHATTSVTVSASGGSTVEVAGDPEDRDVDTSGGSTVTF
ncbi:MAG: DUF2807 domain-containing protein [Alphaproteobacteria bacterium]|nr:DUF2807 domain-containing protein [Alphaproteobacteria bacterium]